MAEKYVVTSSVEEQHILAETVCFSGIVSALRGDYPQALKSFHESLEISRISGERWFEALSLSEIVSVEILMGKTENLHERAQSALDAWRAVGDPRFTAFGLSTLSFSAVKIGRFDEALSALEVSIAIN